MKRAPFAHHVLGHAQPQCDRLGGFACGAGQQLHALLLNAASNERLRAMD
jgi:hypothetical protein